MQNACSSASSRCGTTSGSSPRSTTPSCSDSSATSRRRSRTSGSSTARTGCRRSGRVGGSHSRPRWPTPWPSHGVPMNRREELEDKLAQVRRWLAQTDAAAVHVAGNAAFAWLTCGGDNCVSLGAEEGAAGVLVTSDQAFLLGANNELQRILDEELAEVPLEPISWPWYQPTQARTLVERLAARAPVVSDLGQLGLSRAAASFAALRFTLLPPEIERYRRLGQDAAAAVEAACCEARPG